MDMTVGLLQLLHGAHVSLWGSIGQWVFFDSLFGYLDNEVIALQKALSQDLGRWVGSVAIVLLTIWIIWQGWLIATGRSRESMMALVSNTLRSMVIVIAATTLAVSGGDLYQMICGFSKDDGEVKTSLVGLITRTVAGEGKENPYKNIDGMMTEVQAMMTAIDAVPAFTASIDGSNVDALKADKDDAQMWLGVGVAGPAVVSGALLFMYKIALALFVGLGPIFILSLLFEQTKGMFQRWLWYGVGTMFSLAVLSVMVAIVQKVMEVMIASVVIKIGIAAAFNSMSGAGGGLGAGVPGGITGAAMQQGGLGMVMTVMLITVPPMAATFFQGAVASGFGAYSAFGSVGRGGGGGANRGLDSAGRAPGAPGYDPPRSGVRNDGSSQGGGGGIGTNAEQYGTPNHSNRVTSNSAQSQGVEVIPQRT